METLSQNGTMPGAVQKPAVWTWYIVYAAAMALMYALVSILGIVFLLIDPSWLEMESVELKVQGAICFLMGAILFLPFAVAPFLPKRPWVWIYHLVLICLGMTSCCCLPATIPLLIFWLKPECKQFFGRAA